MITVSPLASFVTVAGTVEHDDIRVIVTYTANVYTLTIRYVDGQGREMHESYQAQVKFGDNYDVLSPIIPHYVTKKERVSGIMPAQDTTITVIYTLPGEYVIIDDFGIPLGITTGLNCGESFE